MIRTGPQTRNQRNDETPFSVIPAKVGIRKGPRGPVSCFRRNLKFSLFVPVVLLSFLLTLLPSAGLAAEQKRLIGVDDRSARNASFQLAQQRSAPPRDLPPLPPVPPPMPRQSQTEWTPDSSAMPVVPPPPEMGDRSVLPPSQSIPTEQATATAPTATPAKQEVATWDIKMGQVSLNFDDADIYSVIQTIFANVLHYNYVIDPRVKGRVTFRSIAPVAQQDVLPLMEVILRLNGIAILEEGGLYRIVPMSEAPREPAPVGYGRDPQSVKLSGKSLLQVVPIRYLLSTDMVKLLTPFVSTNAVVVDVPKSNYIIIVDTDSNVRRLLKLIDLFDNEQQREKRPQVFLYHAQNTKAKDMAALLQQIFLGAKPAVEQSASRTTGIATATQAQPSTTQPLRTQPSSPMIVSTTTSQMVGESIVSANTKIIADEILNAVVIIATAEDYAAIKQTIDKIDVVPRQVLIEAVVAQVELKDDMSLGIAWSLKANFGSVLSSTIGLNLPISASDSGGFSFTAVDPGGDMRAMISALATVSKAKLLATPHILVSDNREARIQVGQQVPIVTSETYGSTTVAPQRTIQYKDIGTILKVKPRINEGGLVSIELNQEISDYSTIKLYSNEDQIIINKNDVTTNLIVQDGQTIIIGGLIREKISDSNAGIPWLNKIPILGYLFGNTKDESSRSEIVILLTPHVMKSIQDANVVTEEYTYRFNNMGFENTRLKAPVEKNKGMTSPEDKKNNVPGTPIIKVPVQ